MSNATQVMTLTEFLLARIAEDEAVANRATEGAWTWRMNNWVKPQPEVVPVDSWNSSGRVAILPDLGLKQDAEHIARYDPARVLAECEAKRRVAHLHGPKYKGSTDCRSCADGWEDMTYGQNGYTPEPYPCLTARNLALIYSDHPDYRDEWRP